MDLRDLWRPGGGVSRLTYRRLQVLVDHLPPESATKTALRESIPEADREKLAKLPRAGHGPWSQQEMLLAAVADRLAWVVYAVYAVHNAKPEQPSPIPRPGVSTRPRRQFTDAQYDHLRAMRRRPGVTDGQ